MKYNSIVCAMVASLAQASTDGKCRALILSGGSNNASWEAGVIWGLAHYGTASDFAWDVVSGVSAGAINSAGIATWPAGTEVEMSEWLSDQQANLTTDEIWIQREGSPVDLLFKDPSFLDDDPAIAKLNEIISYKGAINRRFVMSAVDVNTGDYIAMTQKDTVFEDLAQSAMSSGSIPVIFPPQHIKDYVFMDGGTVWNVNLSSAIDQCMEIVDNYEDIIVDVAICDYSALPQIEIEKNAAKNFMQAKSLKSYYTSTDALFQEAQAFPGLKMRYYFQEQNSCPGAGGLSFDNSTTWCLQEAGRADAKAMLEIGADQVHKTLEEWYSDKELKKEHPRFRSYLNKAFNYLF